jgi:chromosome segregation ATPase
LSVPATCGADDEKASLMTDPAIDAEAPSAAEAAHFLRRFADLMSNGHNAKYLLRAAELLEALTAQASAASDEERLWRYKYETQIQHTDALEAERERLKGDIDGHVSVASLILAERDTLKAALEAREAELLDMIGALQREQDQSATQSQAHESAVAELRVAFDQERLALRAAADVSSREIEQQRRVYERECLELSAELKRREQEAAELRSGFDREREELQSRLTSREDALAALRVDSDRESAALREQIETLEAKRAELRSGFERISQLRVEPEQQPVDRFDPGRSGDERGHLPAPTEASAIVSKETLRQACAQFEFLARESIRRGDIATQAMCELGAHTMQLALAADESPDASPIGQMALSILSLSDLNAPVGGESGRSVG